MAEKNIEEPVFEQLAKDYTLSNIQGYPTIEVPTSDDSHMTKLIWPRVKFPSEVHRWNLTEELLSYLISFESHSQWMTSQLLNKPPSGSMWLFNKKEVKNYKNDGYDWKTRSSSCKTVREDRTKLKVFGHIIIYALYTHCESNHSFHRRCYWLIKNPNIVLVHYLDTSQRKATKKYYDQVISLTDATPSNDILLTVSDENLCQYLFSNTQNNEKKKKGEEEEEQSVSFLLNSLAQKIKNITRHLASSSSEHPVTTATLVTCIQNQLFPNLIKDRPPINPPSSTPSPPPHISDIVYHTIRLLQLQRTTPTQQWLLPKGSELLLNKTTPILPEQQAVTEPRPIPTPTNNHVINEEAEFFNILRPPSLDGLKAVLPEPLDVDHTPLHCLTTPTSDNMTDVTEFAQSLLSMRPLQDVITNTCTNGGTTCNTTCTSNNITCTADMTSTTDVTSTCTTSNDVTCTDTTCNGVHVQECNGDMEEEMERNNFLTDEFLNHFLNELNTAKAPPMTTPTCNLPLTDQAPHSSDHTPFNIELDSESVKLLTEFYKEEMTMPIAPPLSPVSQYMASLNESMPSTSYYDNGSNEYQDTSCHGDEGYYGNSVMDSSLQYFHQNGYQTPPPTDPLHFANSLLQPINVTSHTHSPNHTPSSSYAHSIDHAYLPNHVVSVDHTHSTNHTHLIDHASSSSHAHSPTHISSSHAHSPSHIIQTLEDYRSPSPLQSPSSPSQASISSSLSTAGGESPLVVELCELMSESPNVQQADFAHLSLTGPEQQELLQASRVIQKTMRRCKERPNSMVTLQEKNAALLIERSYKRYREIKDRRDQAARCIQNQYRLYRRRNDELKRAALFIQQMYRYQRRRRCEMSSLVTHSHDYNVNS